MFDGYTYIRSIGRGGFSDVYLYTQEMPFREVAIKVLRTDALTDALRRQFTAEANLMARLSGHPNIASIYAAGVDTGGEPYLVMEYCSGGSLGETYRTEPLPIRDVLRIGILLCGALDAAHRLGIVHRDIKPGNILITRFGVPVLSDFGISTIDAEFPEATLARSQIFRGEASSDSDLAFGLSLPWAAPETLAVPPVAGTSSDRYSLAATLYSLAEGRTPQEIPGGPNDAESLATRILDGFIRTMRREGVPSTLETELRRAMATDPAQRHIDSIEFGRALQRVERQLGLDVTGLEAPGDAAPSDAPDSHTPRPATTAPEIGTALADRDPATPGSPFGPPPTVAGVADAPAPPAPSPHQLRDRADGSDHGAASGALGDDHADPAGPGDHPIHPVPDHLPGGADQTPAGLSRPDDGETPADPGKSRGQRTRSPRLLIGLAIVLVAVVAGVWWLIANRSDAEPPIASVTVSESDGIYQVRVPAGLQAPEEAEVRTIRHGLGAVIERDQGVIMTVDHTSWLPGYAVELDPRPTDDGSNQIRMSVEDLQNAVGHDIAGQNVDSVLLIAAPRGYFASQAEGLGIDYRHSQLAVIRIVESY